MARTNKYTSLNFNDIYEKKIINPTATATATSRSPSSSAAHHNKSYSFASSRLGHGGMLVLSRPSPKPQPPPQQPPLSQSQPQQPPSNSLIPPATLSPPSSKSPDSYSISLRPQGKTGGNPTFQERENNNNNNNKVDVPSPKSNKFVPPHLRPGFVAREAASVPEFQKPRQGNFRPGSAHGNFHGSPNRYAEDGRPKSGSGYERRMRAVGPGHGAAHAPAPAPAGFESDSKLNRPGSGGSRPSSSRW